MLGTEVLARAIAGTSPAGSCKLANVCHLNVYVNVNDLRMEYWLIMTISDF